MISTQTNYGNVPLLRKQEISRGEKVSMPWMSVDIKTYGKTHTFKFTNTMGKTIDEITKDFGRLEMLLDSTVSAYFHAACVEINKLVALIRQRKLDKFRVKKELNAIVKILGEHESFIKRNQMERTEAWKKMMIGVYADITSSKLNMKFLNLQNHNHLLKKEKRFGDKMDLAIQFLLAAEMTELCLMKFDVLIKDFQKKTHTSFSSDVYAPYRPTELYHVLENLQYALFSKEACQHINEVGHNQNVSSCINAVVNQFEDVSTFNEVAKQVILNDTTGAFDDDTKRFVTQYSAIP